MIQFFIHAFFRWEARFQMMRDKLVEEAVVSVLRDRAMDCISYEGYSGSEVADPTSKCGELKVLTIVISLKSVKDFFFKKSFDLYLARF